MIYRKQKKDNQMEVIFFGSRAERAGVDDLGVGDITSVHQKDVRENESANSFYLIQQAIHGHGRYYGKKFQCRTVDGVLYVKRKA